MAIVRVILTIEMDLEKAPLTPQGRKVEPEEAMAAITNALTETIREDWAEFQAFSTCKVVGEIVK